MLNEGKIKVAHILTRLDFGGAQLNTLYTVSHLDKERFETYLLTGPGGTMQEIPSEISIGILDDLRREISPWHDIRAVFSIARALKRIRPDIVHTHSSKAGILGRIAAKIASVPCVVHTFHGFGFHPYQNAIVRGFYVLLEKICAKFTSSLVFVSKSNMEYAESFGIGKKSQYNLIRSGIRLSSYPAKANRADILKSFGIDGNPVIVFSIGNSKPQKNPGDFIRAAAEISRTCKNVIFIFAGGGTELPEFRRLAKELDVEHSCLLPGWRADSAELMSICDIYAMTSLWEGLPRSLVEAFASGKPAVCYRADGVMDIIKDGVNGYSVDKKDLKSYVKYLKLLIEDEKLRSRLAEGAKKADLSEFDIDYMVSQQETLYSNLHNR